MQNFKDKNILLGVCGGVAAYKSAYLVRKLTKLGASVKVVMTKSAQEFITPLQMQALSGNEVRTDLFDLEAERAMGHIELARWADVLIIAPASANCLAKMAHGMADDLLSTIYLVATIPVIVCPAMNQSMWGHPATLRNCEILKEREVIFVGPEEGSQACGEVGLGRVSEPESIINALRLYEVFGILAGKKVVITAGPTREAIDPVRFLSNYSSGKMGYALAQAAFMAGAQVTLISGPCAQKLSSGIHLIKVESAKSMYEATMKAIEEGCIFIGAAAVADFAPVKAESLKIKKQEQIELSLQLIKNVDILLEVSALKKAAFVVGFAAETNEVLIHAKEKLINKHLDMIIANKVGDGLGFDKEENQVTILTKKDHIELPLTHKTALAGQIIAIIAANL